MGGGRLGGQVGRMEAATGVRGETGMACVKAAGSGVRPPGSWGHATAKPAKEVSTDSGAKPAKEVSTDSAPPQWPPRPGRAPQASACEPYRDVIVEAASAGRNTVAVYQGLGDDHGFRAGDASAARVVPELGAR